MRAVAANQLLAQVAFGACMPFLPFYVRELGVVDPDAALIWAGVLGSASSVTLAIMAPVWGALADRFGRKLMLLRVAIGRTAIVGAMGFVDSVPQLLALRLAQGGFTGSLAAGASLVAAATASERAGRNLGLVQAAVQIGNTLGPALGGLLISAVGVRQVFFVSAALMLSGGLVVAAFAREPARPAAAASPRAAGVAPRAWLTSPALRHLMLLIVGVQFAASALFAPLPLFAESLRAPSDPPAQAITGMALGLAAVVAAVTAPFAGRLIDRVGPPPVLCAALVVSALATGALAASSSVWHLVALEAAVGFGTAGQAAGVAVLTRSLAPAGREGSAFGLAATAQAIGYGLGPVVGSSIAAAWGLRIVFPACAAVLLLLALAVRRR